MVMKRSSNSRIWKAARTRIAISSSEWPARCSSSISSPIARASSSESHAAITATFSPGASSVRSVLPSRPSLWAIRCEAAARMWAVER